MEMEQENDQNKIKIKGKTLREESPIFYKMLVFIVIIAGFLQTLVRGGGDIFQFLFASLGAMTAIIIMAYILGIVPVLLLQKRIKNIRIKIYGIAIIVVAFASTFGTIISNQ